VNRDVTTSIRELHEYTRKSGYDPSSGRLTPFSNRAILQPIRKKGIVYALE
jgi:hypothetical protein